MADVDIPMIQLVNLAIGTPEVGAVNFNLLQRVLSEILKMTELDSVNVKINAADAAKLEESIKPLPQEAEDQDHDEQEEHQAEGSIRRSGLHHCPISPEKIDKLLEDMTRLKFDVEDLTSKVTTMSAAADTVPFQEMRGSLTQIDSIQERVIELESILANFKDLDLGLGGSEERGIGHRLSYLEKHVETHEEEFAKITNIMDDKLKHIMGQFENMEKDLDMINEKLTITESSTKLFKRSTMLDPKSSIMMDQAANTINNLISRMSSLQHDLDNLSGVTNNLIGDQEQRQMQIDALIEQVEMLKIAKADKINMEDVLAAKADMVQVHRKVSHDHFVTKLDQLNSLLGDAFTRLDTHEELWQQEVDYLKMDIESKLDRMELSPLKEYVNEKLNMLQDKMKALAVQRREGMTAGAKKRIIRDVLCISCDNKSVMKPENTLEDVVPPPPLPPQQSVKPYLTYKLDQVRKQQKKLPPGRNLLHFEELLLDTAATKHPRDIPPSPGSGERFVNRYVGGSHTITTPQQRVTRTGNFFETWGPVITPVKKTQQSAA